MDHQHAQELFSDYLEGELPPAQRQALEAHLEGCASCRQELAALRKTLSSLSGLKTLPPPDGFVHQVQQRIHRRSRGRFFMTEKMFFRIPFEWISFIIILFMLATYLLLVLGQAKEVHRPAATPEQPAAEQEHRRLEKQLRPGGNAQ